MKFTDEEYISLHNAGLSDTLISKILGVSRSTTRQRRLVLNLLPHFSNFKGQKARELKDVKRQWREFLDYHMEAKHNWRINNLNRYREYERRRWYWRKKYK